MPRSVPPAFSVVLTFLRAERGWTQKELADAVGISDKVLSFYERGRTHLPRPRLDSMAAAMGLRPDAVDAAIFALQQIRPAHENPGMPGRLSEAELQSIERAAAVVGQAAAEATRTELEGQVRQVRIRQAHEEAAALWNYLKDLPAWERRVLVEGAREYRSWALAVRLCEESVKAAGNDAGRALDLANLALRIAELAPGEKGWNRRLQGLAWAFLGNARRVAGDLPGAEVAFDKFYRLRDATLSTEFEPVEEWRILDLEASLRREQRRWDQALRLHQQAQVAAPTRAQGRVLLNTAVTLEQSGDHECAVTTLSQAARHVNAKRDPRLGFALQTNLALNLCRLGRYRAAEDLLPEARRLAAQLGHGLDLLRLRWVEGLTAAGLGRPGEAIEALSRVRSDFLAHGIAYDAALATLELALLFLGDGRTQEVKALARQLAPLFKAQGVHREALAALTLFRDAAEKERVTVELARRLTDFLRRARYNPDLRFEGIAE
jgi:transcriptional regulator with XRE-family HTH domain